MSDRREHKALNYEEIVQRFFYYEGIDATVSNVAEFFWEHRDEDIKAKRYVTYGSHKPSNNKNAYDVYINNARLPFPPNNIEIKHKSRNETVDLAHGGEFNVIKFPGLAELTMNVIIPHKDSDLTKQVKYTKARWFLDQRGWISLLDNLKTRNRKHIIELAIIRTDDPIYDGMSNSVMYCTLEDYTIIEDAKNYRDLVIELKFKKYELTETLKVSLEGEGQDNPGGDASVTEEIENVEEPEEAEIDENTETYTVVYGDTLWAIANRHYGDPMKYVDIAKWNNMPDPNILSVGQVLILK